MCASCGSFEECSHDEPVEESRISKAGEQVQLSDSISTSTSSADSNCEMITVTPITGGQEVFNTYGSELSNAKLIASYGFTLEANPHDICTFTLPALLQDSTATLSPEQTNLYLNETTNLVKRWGKSSLSPLLIPPEPSSLIEENLFQIDADARLSLSFFIFLSLIHLRNLVPDLDPPHSDQTYFYLRRLDSIIASLQSESGPEEGESEGSKFAKLGEKDREAVEKLVRGVERVCEARRKGYWESEMEGVQVFELADVSFSPFFLSSSPR